MSYFYILEVCVNTVVIKEAERPLKSLIVNNRFACSGHRRIEHVTAKIIAT